jgi:hypothetical protein
LTKTSHGKRAVKAERRAERDQAHMQPDAEILGTDEAGAEEIAQAHCDQHHQEQHGENECRSNAENRFDHPQNACRHAVIRSSLFNRMKFAGSHSTYLPP